MYKLGVTGPIASGKTALTRILSKLPHTFVIDVDQIARNLYTPGSPAYVQVLNTFKSHSILHPNGEINRRKLGEVVFASHAELQRLNDICFPILKAEIQSRLLTSPGSKLAIIDAGVLLQAGWDSLCNEVWTTLVKDHIAVQRIMQRDKLTEKEAVDRVKSQVEVQERIRKCQVVMETNGTVQELEEKVMKEVKKRLPWIFE